MGKKRQLIDIKRKKREAETTYFVEVPILTEKPIHEEDKKQIEKIWSNIQLASPPLFNGKNFGI